MAENRFFSGRTSSLPWGVLFGEFLAWPSRMNWQTHRSCSGLAPDMWIVIVGRAISGIGGAGVMTMSSIIITGRLPSPVGAISTDSLDIVSKREVAKWRSFVNVSMTLGRSIGGPVGGVLTDTIGWRWYVGSRLILRLYTDRSNRAFLLQAPLLGLASLLVIIQLKLARPASSNAPSSASRIDRIDFRGAFLLATSIAAIILLLDQGGKSFAWVSLPTAVLSSCGLLTLALFIYTELHVAVEPIFNIHILRRPNVVPSYLVSSLQVAAQVGMMFTVPLYFQVTARASSTVAGAHLIPAVAGNTVGGLASGMFIRRTGNYKPVLVAAGLIACISYVLQLTRWNGDTGPWESLYIVFGGLGSGSASSAAFVSMTAFLEPEEIAMATGGFLLLISFSMTAGITSNYTLLGTVFKRQLQSQLHGRGAHKVSRPR